ncbi:hypothetical protein ADK70_15070 [Streptomyces rimosus subsp. pseudoverticillatus]|nr:hypothetical protein ADK70_15070 [Streptomyces rimosus subsp. pseudoverticillatus]
MRAGRGTGREATSWRAITSKRARVTSAPKACTSWLIAESVGWVSLHNCESSQASRDRLSGTEMPSSAATPTPVTAMMSLSYRIAVGRSGASSRERVARAPSSPAKPAANCRVPSSPSSRSVVSNAVSLPSSDQPAGAAHRAPALFGTDALTAHNAPKTRPFARGR